MEQRSNNLQKVFIYSLKEKGTDIIKYIGKTNDLERRLSEHILESKNKKTHKSNWINSVLKRNGVIEITKIEEVFLFDWKKREKYWIKKIGLKNLTNHLNGGEGGREKKDFLSYEESKKWIKNNKKITRKSEWDIFCKENTFPCFLPKCPEKTYLKEWKGYGDWLCTKRDSNKKISENFICFDNAKKIIAKLKFKDQKDWGIFCLSKKRPNNIPSCPQRIYKTKWKGWADWLGNKRFSTKNKLCYDDAKKIVHRLKIKNHVEWNDYYKNNKIYQIPYNPKNVYKKEWKGWTDWLGKENRYIDFESAKLIAKKLNLKRKKDWFDNYEKNNLFMIPKHPQVVYSKNWINWYDWLGK